MPTRRTGVLTALLLTAALFAAIPGLWRDALAPSRRVHPSLRPQTTRTLTVWLMPETAFDSTCIRQLCTEFEKQNRSLRIFLRSVTPDELSGENAVLPDVVLFVTGELPPDRLLPLADLSDPAGMYGGVCYAQPLWYAPMVLSYPASWGDDPWPRLVECDAFSLPEGTALQQLLLSCPPALASRLQNLPSAPSRADSPMVIPLQSHERRGDGFSAVALTPDTSDRVRCAALCRDSEGARLFMQFLSQADGSAHKLVSAAGAVTPNAFAHTRQELMQICLDGFTRGEDPVKTLLSLR